MNKSLNEQAIDNLKDEWMEWLKERHYPPIGLGQINENVTSFCFRHGDDESLIPVTVNRNEGMLKYVLAGEVNWSVAATVEVPNPLSTEERALWNEAIKSGAALFAKSTWKPGKSTYDDIDRGNNEVWNV